MTRRMAPTKLVDECHYNPACPFGCPLTICVKEYPGGADAYKRDFQIKQLMQDGKDLQEIAKIIGISVSLVEKRFNNANFHNINTSEALSII